MLKGTSCNSRKLIDIKMLKKALLFFRLTVSYPGIFSFFLEK